MLAGHLQFPKTPSPTQLLAQGCPNFGETEEEEGAGAEAWPASGNCGSIGWSRLPIPRRGRLILHKTGRGRPGVAAGDARTPCPPGCRQDGQGRPQPSFLCAERTGQKREVGSRVTGRFG